MLPSGWDDLCPSPDLRRKLGLAAAFIALGSVACMSGVTLLVAENEPGARSHASSLKAGQ
jgi:hypothetical protein